MSIVEVPTGQRMIALTVKPAQGRSYPVSVRNRAVELHEAGWSPHWISKILEGEIGVRPHASTVRAWVDPEFAVEERRRLRMNERARRRASGMRMLVVDEDRKLELLLRLDMAGLSPAAIGKALAVFVGDELTRHQVDYAVAHRRYPKRVKLGETRA